MTDNKCGHLLLSKDILRKRQNLILLHLKCNFTTKKTENLGDFIVYQEKKILPINNI